MFRILLILIGGKDKWPKSKYQNFKSTQWFSYKLWINSSEEPIVYLHNWPLPEQHHFLKKQWEIHFLIFFKYWLKRSPKIFLNRNMDILISNLLSESIFDFGKWSNWKYANTCICVFSVWLVPKVKNISEHFGQYLKSQKIDLQLYFQTSDVIFLKFWGLATASYN